MNIYFEIPGDVQPESRARLAYAFRLFCAIYGHTPILDPEKAPRRDVAIRYRGPGAESFIADARTVWLCRGYRGRDPRVAAPPPVKYARNGLITVLHYTPERSKAPDWVGEIFEWVSCADEYSVSARDRQGRVPFEASYTARHGIDANIPYAALAMRGLQEEICHVVPRAGEHPAAPDGAGAHVVIPTHDVDYLPAGRGRAVRRLLHNMMSSSLHRNPALAVRQAALALRTASGAEDDPLDRIASVSGTEQQLEFSASYYFAAERGHRRDAGYTMKEAGAADTMRFLASRGMEIGLCGSHTSLDRRETLEREAQAMSAQGFTPRGGRQHRLRYTLDRLISAVETAGLEYDTSIGWPTQLGFRAGACFAFPPYDFGREGPAGFLEFPLVAVDEALLSPLGMEGQRFHEVAQVLAASRRMGWGGISLLWHPVAFGEGWLPAGVGEIFWRLANDRLRWNDRWMNGTQFLAMARRRFVEAGLLKETAPTQVIEMPAGGVRAAVAAGQSRVPPAPASPPQKAVGA